RRVRRSPIHLAPRQRGEGGAQRVSVGRVRGAPSLGAALSWTKRRLVQVPAVWLSGAAKKEVTGTPLTLPLLRNGPLPLPASRARGVWAVLGRDMARQRCVNPIAAFAGMTVLRVVSPGDRRCFLSLSSQLRESHCGS